MGTLKRLLSFLGIKQISNVTLTRDPQAGTYTLPAGATLLGVYVNGLRYTAGEDYSLAAGVITPNATAGNWPSDALVVADIEQ